MRTLLSTRLFSNQVLTPEPWLLARKFGFTTLELNADGSNLDIFEPGQTDRIGWLAESMGVHVPWIHLGSRVLDRLTDRPSLVELGDVIRKLRLQMVTADTRQWGVSPSGTFLNLDDLRVECLTNGARLVLELGHFEETIVERLPPTLGICWDLAAPGLEEDEAIRQVEEILGSMARGRLIGIRVAHRGDGFREVPAEREARILEEVWRLHAPGALIYDVDDPSGYGSAVELRRTLDAIRHFHAGGSRPTTEEGGLFWAALAPG